jgi:uncharacterized protein (TIGR00251 family)
MQETTRLSIKVVPGSSRNCVAGWLGEALKVRVTAPAEAGKANAAVEATVAEALGVSQKSIRVIAGRTSPRKTLEITDLCESEIRRRLAKGAL